MNNNTNNNQKLILLAFLAIAVFVGLAVVLNRTVLQNKAATSEAPLISDQVCRYNAGTCSIDPNFVSTTGAQWELVLYENGNRVQGLINGRELKFSAKSGDTYECRVELISQQDGLKCQESSSITAPSCGPVPTGETTPTSTPVLTPPSDECTDCADGKFTCSIYQSQSLQNKELSSSDGSCPAYSIQKVNYSGYAGTCPPKTESNDLDCDKHVVVIETTPASENRTLNKAECLEIKNTGFLMRLHTGLSNDGCRIYDVRAYEKDSAGNPDTNKPLTVCKNCQLKSGCPTSCAEEDLDPNKLIDIPDLPENNNECVPGVCELNVTNACGNVGDSVTIKTFVKSPDGGRLYFDDHYGNPQRLWENVPSGSSEKQHTYDNSGYYDVVLVCKNPQSTEGGQNQNFVCAKRITRMCGKDGEPTPALPSSTPVMTPVVQSCPEINVKLILKCPGPECPINQ